MDEALPPLAGTTLFLQQTEILRAESVLSLTQITDKARAYLSTAGIALTVPLGIVAASAGVAGAPDVSHWAILVGSVAAVLGFLWVAFMAWQIDHPKDVMIVGNVAELRGHIDGEQFPLTALEMFVAEANEGVIAINRNILRRMKTCFDRLLLGLAVEILSLAVCLILSVAIAPR